MRAARLRFFLPAEVPMVRSARAALVVALVVTPVLVPIVAHAGPADDLVASIEASDPALALVLRDVLAKNPEITAARARALAAAQVPAQAASLPDPMLDATAYPQSPDGRQLAIEYSQEVPARGKRRLGAESAAHDADATDADVEAVRLRLVGEARELWLRIASLDDRAAIARDEREALAHFEELARATYENGEGAQQDAVRLQAELTRSGLLLADLDGERLAEIVALNALRGRPGQLDLGAPALPPPLDALPDPESLLALASSVRPEVLAASARLAAAASRIELARAESRPDLTLRGGWMLMRGGMDAGMGDKSGWRDDEAMVGVGIRLPVHGARIRAGVEQAVQEREAALADRDAVRLGIEREVAEMTARFAILRRRLRTSETELAIQSDQVLRSAESAYASGSGASIDLLDAERMSFDARREAADLRLDLAMLVARLEIAVGAPLATLTPDSHGGTP
jgi:outer membrane protein TolC